MIGPVLSQHFSLSHPCLKQGLGETPDAKKVRNKVSNSQRGVSGETEGQKTRKRQ
jgi:hypothetical protein